MYKLISKVDIKFNMNINEYGGCIVDDFKEKGGWEVRIKMVDVVVMEG